MTAPLPESGGRRRLERCEAAGFSMAVQDVGDGAPVVCLHSGGLSSRQWGRLRDRLAPRYRVLLPDFIGYGSSTPWTGEDAFDLDHDVACVEALLGSLAEPAHVVGHSYGGLVALRAGLRRPSRIRSLTLFEPVAFGVLVPAGEDEAAATLPWVRTSAPRLAPEATEAWLRDFIDWWMGVGAWAGLGDERRRGFRAAAPKLYAEVRSLADDARPAPEYARLAVPALVLSAERSPLAARRTAALVAEALPGARLHVLAGMGHMAPISNHAEVNPLIEAHIDQAAATPRHSGTSESQISE